MTLNLAATSLSRFSHHSSLVPLTKPLETTFLSTNNSVLFSHLSLSGRRSLTSCGLQGTSISSSFNAQASPSDSQEGPELLNDRLLSTVSGASDAGEALDVISRSTGRTSGFVGVADCCTIITAAIERNNAELALSIFHAMRSSFTQGGLENGALVERWRWSRPDVGVYTTLITGLATSLRVSDALRLIQDICTVGVSAGEEVRFGKVVRCPTCMVAIAVAQPQQGVQIVSCAKCRYQYELLSGDIISIDSEELSKEVPFWERGLRFLQIMKKSYPSAVHSVVVRTPSGMARTQRFATETVDLPAQEGERVTIASAAPSNVYRDVGPFKFSPKAPDFYPGEPLCLTNHKDCRQSVLLRAPSKDGNSFKPSFLIPFLAVLVTGDAASGMIDPSLPQLISFAAVGSLAFGVAFSSFVLPQLNQLPQRSVDAVAIKQQLLSQYDVLQSRIKDLKEAAEKEVWMLARMCQLESKICAVGEPAYRARRSKVKRVREGLESSLKGRIELIDSYARISSMIEIEVEMDSDVLAAEAAGSAENIGERIQQIMEIENLEEKWKLQAEANDEAERLLSSQPTLTEQD